MNIDHLDLNLMKVFYHIYQTQSVRQAAEKLHISQSACSHSLSRLRERLNDELFIRINGHMVATDQAQRLAQSVIPALQLLYSGLTTATPFEPNVGEHHFTLSGYDFATWCVMPQLTTYLAQHFPNITVRFVHTQPKIPTQQLESGEIDLALGFDHEEEKSNHIGNAVLLSGQYCIAMDENHPALQTSSSLQLDDFLHYSHVLIAPWSEQRGIVDVTLGKLNKKRRIATTLPGVLSAPYSLPGTDYFLAAPQSYIKTLASTLHLSYCQPPISLPDYQIKLYWHKTKEKDPKLRWIMELLLTLFTAHSSVSSKSQNFINKEDV